MAIETGYSLGHLSVILKPCLVQHIILMSSLSYILTIFLLGPFWIVWILTKAILCYKENVNMNSNRVRLTIFVVHVSTCTYVYWYDIYYYCILLHHACLAVVSLSCLCRKKSVLYLKLLIQGETDWPETWVLHGYINDCLVKACTTVLTLCQKYIYLVYFVTY